MGVDPKKCTVDFTGIGIDDQNYFTFTARDSKGDPLLTGGDLFGTKMIHCEGGEVKIDLVDNGDGTYKGVFEPVQPDSYFIVIGLMNPNGRVIQDMIRGSPFTVRVGPKPVELPKEPAVATLSYVHGTNYKQALVKHKSYFTITAVGAHNSRLTHGGEPFKTKIYAPRGSKLPTIPSSVQDLQDGSYIVSYMPMNLGEYRVEVTLNDVPLPGTPFEVNAVNGLPSDEIDARKVQVLFTESKADERTHSHNFVIAPKNAEGNPVNFCSQFKVKILSPESIEVKSWIGDNGDGTYSVKFKPELDGVYLVQVDHQGSEPVKGSPFKVEWKIKGDVLEAVSVLPAPEKLKTEVDKIAGFQRERSSSAPTLPNASTPNSQISDSASASAPTSPAPSKIILTQPSFLPKPASLPQTGSPALPRSRSPSSVKGPTSPVVPTVGGPSFLPKSTPQAKVPPKNPPKNPSSGSKWTPASAPKQQ